MRTDIENLLQHNAFTDNEFIGEMDYGSTTAGLDLEGELADYETPGRSSAEVRAVFKAAGFGRWVLVCDTDQGITHWQEFDSEQALDAALANVQTDYNAWLDADEDDA